MMEEAVLFGETGSLVGILTDSEEAKRERRLPAVLLLNSGIVHRVGPNRLHVKMARTLSAMGLLVFRFDFSGIGDSEACDDGLPFEVRTVRETQQAMDYLNAARGVDRFILAGICSGAFISFHAACRDPRVIGAALINGQGYLTDQHQLDAIRNRTLVRHYLRMALFSSFSAKNLSKLLMGKVDYLRLKEMIGGFRPGSLFGWGPRSTTGENSPAERLRRLVNRGVDLLLVHCEGDEGLDYLRLVLGDSLDELRACRKFRIEIIDGANHTFTLRWSQEHLLRIIRNWTEKIIRA